VRFPTAGKAGVGAKEKDMIKRIGGFFLLAGLILASLHETLAQQPERVWRVGLFHVGLDHIPPSLPSFRETLKTLGYEEGRNITLDWRNLADEAAAHATAREFVKNRVDLIVAFENQTVRAAKAATSEIPVVFLHVSDPVEEGFVKSLARPGGNMTGFSGLWWDFPDKKLELYKELVPRLRNVLTLIDPQDPTTARLLSETRKAATVLKLRLVEREVVTQADLERLFKSIKTENVDGVFIVSPNLYYKFSSVILALSQERRLPCPSHRKEWVEQGALFSYATDAPSVGPFAARYADRILKGAKPSDLPVEQSRKFEFVVSSKAAKQLGLTMPPSVLARADQVIE
jgi:putative ABC transport system substrate-binding protein